MFNNKKVTVGGGRTVYKAVHTGYDLRQDRLYMLIPVNGIRKRYNVPEQHLADWSEVVYSPVKTSRGLVKPRRTGRGKLESFSGSTRKAYLDKKWVYKVSRFGTYGDEQNMLEATMWKLQNDQEPAQGMKERIVNSARRYLARGVRIAECHLLEDGTLMMERVKTIYNLRGESDVPKAEARSMVLPDWTTTIDSCQVGYNHNGEIVAYDI